MNKVWLNKLVAAEQSCKNVMRLKKVHSNGHSLSKKKTQQYSFFGTFFDFRLWLSVSNRSGLAKTRNVTTISEGHIEFLLLLWISSTTFYFN